MEKLVYDLLDTARAQEQHGLNARKAGRLDDARRYFARAEAYAFSAGAIARELGLRELVKELDALESINFRRATNAHGAAYA